jgi:hypothetical protein
MSSRSELDDRAPVVGRLQKLLDRLLRSGLQHRKTEAERQERSG